MAKIPPHGMMVIKCSFTLTESNINILPESNFKTENLVGCFYSDKSLKITFPTTVNKTIYDIIEKLKEGNIDTNDKKP